jgi:hypothetical protein
MKLSRCNLIILLDNNLERLELVRRIVFQRKIVLGTSSNLYKLLYNLIINLCLDYLIIFKLIVADN